MYKIIFLILFNFLLYLESDFAYTYHYVLEEYQTGYWKSPILAQNVDLSMSKDGWVIIYTKSNKKIIIPKDKIILIIRTMEGKDK